ncbi:MAG: translation elongation factor Ts [Gammaproteobacteria bacterium]|nr:translation elongation factor Ts [Gammaproteobacteria bacterium]
MTKITASMVAELRSRTDAPMMDCKKALTESMGDMEKAEEILRVRLGNKAQKAASRITSEGMVAIAILGQSGGMIEVNCETDFVSKNDSFVNFANALAKIVAVQKPIGIPQLAEENLELDGLKGTVEDIRTGLIGKMGENISLRRMVCFSTSNQLTYYLHGGRMGVVVEYIGSESAARDVAMHIAAMKPMALSKEEIAPDIIEKERSVALAKAKDSGKPENILVKMVDGSVNKFLSEVTLLSQAFVKNDKLSVNEYLTQNKTKVISFKLFIVGEGLEKRVENFAEEVAQQVRQVKQ